MPSCQYVGSKNGGYVTGAGGMNANASGRAVSCCTGCVGVPLPGGLPIQCRCVSQPLTHQAYITVPVSPKVGRPFHIDSGTSHGSVKTTNESAARAAARRARGPETSTTFPAA